MTARPLVALSLSFFSPALAQPSTPPAAVANPAVPALSTGGQPSDGGSLERRLAVAAYAHAHGARSAHLAAIERTGVGLYYGDHSGLERLSEQELRAWMAGAALPDATPELPRKSSCIDWALECVAAGYAAVGQEKKFALIKARVVREGGLGTTLARLLIADGWSGIYWNPDTLTPQDGQQEHPFSAKVARGKKTYYSLRLADLIVDYRPSPGSATPQDLTGLQKLVQVPFWYGLARGGKHTFVGWGATVSEFHWDQPPTSRDAIEESSFLRFPWLSGLIVVPPGLWPR